MSRANRYFDFDLNHQQAHVFEQIIDFLTGSNDQVFVLGGYAGTGKTTLMAGLIRFLSEREISYSLLASTGRAAKILGDKTKSIVSTVHGCIYTFHGLDSDLEKMEATEKEFAVDGKGQISLLFNMRHVASLGRQLYIIDEASMVSDQVDVRGTSFAQFGSGNLLKDIFDYDKNGKFIFIGDPCQLPPANQPNSPALDPLYLQNTYGKSVRSFELTEVVRQSELNGIMRASLAVRRLWKNNTASRWAFFPVRAYSGDIVCKSHADLIATYIDRIRQYGFDYATLICQTNKGCSAINSLVRSSLYGNQPRLNKGELLMVTQNNYLSTLVNGDLVIVEEIGTSEYRCGLSFRQVEVREIASGRVFRLPMVEDLLYGTASNLDSLQHKNLMIDFFRRMKEKGIKQQSDEFKQSMLEDPYLNALKAVFGYALTCHKSQGGEWDEVFVYMDNKIQGMPRSTAYQWFYTAMTRARNKLYTVDDWFIK